MRRVKQAQQLHFLFRIAGGVIVLFRKNIETLLRLLQAWVRSRKRAGLLQKKGRCAVLLPLQAFFLRPS
jgi:hypothetical protein